MFPFIDFNIGSKIYPRPHKAKHYPLEAFSLQLFSSPARLKKDLPSLLDRRPTSAGEKMAPTCGG